MNSTVHKLFKSNNVNIHFPFEPYDVQKDYMDCVVDTLNNSGHALLESPTGTGKTLSLLCSTLAWNQTQPNPAPMIYYASRTHMQLGQAAKEMKRTAYSRIPAVVLSGRANLCLNDDVKHHPGGQHLINRACRNALAKNACSYYSNYEQKLELLDQNIVHDIEDLIDFGRRHQCCPYYASKKFAEAKASIVFTPYNYLLDSSLRKSLQLKLENSVIIFDEAHNIEASFKDCVSGDFSETCLDTINDCCEKLPSMISKALESEKGISRNGYDPKESRIVDEFKAPKENSKSKEKEPKVNPIEELAEKLTSENLRAVKHCSTQLKLEVSKISNSRYQIDSFYDVLKECSITFNTSSKLLTTLESAVSFLQIAGVQNPAVVDKFVSALSNLSDSIALFYPPCCISLQNLRTHHEKLKKFYAAYLERSKIASSKESKEEWKLYFWCLHPAIGLRQMIDSSTIRGIRSLIITSGTLAPMSSFENELEIRFRVKKSFPHIIDQNQMKIMIIGNTPSGKSLESSKAFTDKKEYPDLLGSILVPLFKVLPYGTVVFFQSYALMDLALKGWKSSTIWRQMNAAAKVFVENKKQEIFSSDLSNFKRQIDSTGKTNAVFFGVCRGKLSEGVNLQGNYCRTVLITGLPFPNIGDPKIVLTREFYQKWKNDPKGSLWYTLQMNRALNQTIGRVIRSQSDFGLLLLCDPRFSRCKGVISDWIQRFYPKDPTKFEDTDRNIKEFFGSHGISVTGSATEDVGAFEIGFGSRSQNSKSQNSSTISKPRSSQTLLTQTTNRPMTSEERRAQMLAAYTVSKETIQQIQQKRDEDRREVPGAVVPAKRSKNSSEVFDVLFNVESDNNLTPPDSSSQPERSKSKNVFKKKVQQPSQQQQQLRQVSPTSSPSASLEPQVQSSSQSNVISSNQDYSIMEELKTKPKWNQCELCKNPCDTPYRTNCYCARVACKKCIRILNKKKCRRCNIDLDKSKFKPVFFKSALSRRNRQNS